jgi:polysaccharide biosynthesis protein PslG
MPTTPADSPRRLPFRVRAPLRGIAGLVIIVLLTASQCTSAPAESTDAAFFGVNINRVFNDQLATESVDAHLAAIAASGITQVRTDAMWAFIEPWAADNGALGPLHAETDRRMLAMARHGLRWLPVLDYTPVWQQTTPGDDHSAPTDPEAFARFAAIFASRYGRRGQFWREHPELPYLPVRTYELWNEENTTRFWQPHPEPDRYADLYLQALATIKAIDPTATVAIGGLGHGANAFLKATYRARPQIAGQIDAVAIHPYAPTAAGVMRTIQRVGAVLRSLDARTVPLIITEVGWESEAGSPDALALPEAKRAAAMTELVDAIASRRSHDHIIGLLPYTWWTPRRDPSNGEDWYGLALDDASLTPTGNAYAAAIRSAAKRPPTNRQAHLTASRAARLRD